MHAYLDGKHERRTRDILAELLPGVSISLSSEVSPEIREYERWSTALANAYVQPVMERYLGRLDESLRARGVTCPLFMITSGGGLAALVTARKFPIRLVESGPAGGAILAAALARQCGLDKVLSFDMGGTTAKICLIDNGEPQHSRSFEVARQYRFLKGSGLPAAHPGDRDGRDRRRRRLDRVRRFAVARQRRTGKRRRRAGPGELRPRRDRAHRDRRRRRAGPHRSGLFRRRLDQAVARQGRRSPSRRRSARRSG